MASAQKIQQEYEELCGGQVLVMEREFESGKKELDEQNFKWGFTIML